MVQSPAGLINEDMPRARHNKQGEEKRFNTQESLVDSTTPGLSLSADTSIQRLSGTPLRPGIVLPRNFTTVVLKALIGANRARHCSFRVVPIICQEQFLRKMCNPTSMALGRSR